MQKLVNVVAWLAVSGLGAGLAAWVGHQATAVSRKLGRRRRWASVRLPLGLLLGWSGAAIALVVSSRYWYLASLAITALVLGAFLLRKPAPGEEERLLEEEQKKRLRRYEHLTETYERLLDQLPVGGPAFREEALLPAPREHLARALQQVYWPRLRELSAGRDSQELVRRYTMLAYFIKDDDAAFMNEFIGFVHQKEDVVAHIKQDPEHFILARERMNRIYQQVNAEQDRLMAEWYRAGADFEND